jgi:hypothetical protein
VLRKPSIVNHVTFFLHFLNMVLTFFHIIGHILNRQTQRHSSKAHPSIFLFLTLFFALCFQAACGGSETAVSPISTPTAVSTPTAQTIVQPIATTTFNEDGFFPSARTQFISLDDPVMIPAAQATWLKPGELVIGVVQNGDARAYPISQAAYHHIINDTIGGEPYLVTY